MNDVALAIILVVAVIAATGTLLELVDRSRGSNVYRGPNRPSRRRAA